MEVIVLRSGLVLNFRNISTVIPNSTGGGVVFFINGDRHGITKEDLEDIHNILLNSQKLRNTKEQIELGQYKH